MYDIIFCIFACPTIPKYKNQILKVNETWGKEAIQHNCKMLYFFGEELFRLLGGGYPLKGLRSNYFSNLEV